jgi:hypothetical protein
LGFADLEEKNMEIGACFREVRLLVTTIIIVRRQFCVFQHRSTVAGENQKAWQQTNVCRHLRVLGLFLSGPIPIPVALGRIKSTCNAETWNFHPRFASVCPRSRRHGRPSRIFQRVSAIRSKTFHVGVTTAARLDSIIFRIAKHP